MTKPIICHVVALLLSLMAFPAQADLPLTVEDLITEQKKIRLEVGLAYANAEQRGVSTGEPIIVQTGSASFVRIPTRIGERTSNHDSLVGTLGLRYGLTHEAEIYTRGSYLQTWQRGSTVESTTAHHSNHFADAWLGVLSRVVVLALLLG